MCAAVVRTYPVGENPVSSFTSYGTPLYQKVNPPVLLKTAGQFNARQYIYTLNETLVFTE